MMGGLHLKTPNQKSTRIMQPCSNTGGFTVVETLIVLAITGVMFVAVVGIVSGRQGKAQFTQGINAIKGDIEQVIGEVQSGYYPGVSSEDQGKNKDFVSIGKVLQFGEGYGTDPERYAVYSLITNREATEVGDGTVAVVDEATEIKPLKYGLVTKWMRVGGGANIGAVGFVTYFTERSDSLLYGSQTTQVVPIQPSSLGSSSSSTIGASLASSYPNRNPPGGVQICFDGGTGQSGLITIGSSGRSNSVTLAIHNDDDDCAAGP